MNVEIGIDIIDNKRFDEEILKNKSFLERYFTKRERRYCLSQVNPAPHFAVRFAGKEAVLKALYGFGIECRIENIEIVLDELNVPKVVTHNISIPSNEMMIKISLSHTDSISTAYAVIYSP